MNSLLSEPPSISQWKACSSCHFPALSTSILWNSIQNPEKYDHGKQILSTTVAVVVPLPIYRYLHHLFNGLCNIYFPLTKSPLFGQTDFDLNLGMQPMSNHCCFSPNFSADLPLLCFVSTRHIFSCFSLKIQRFQPDFLSRVEVKTILLII